MIGLPRGVLGLQLPNSIMIEKRIEETGPIVAQSKDVLAKPAREQHVEASLVLPQLSVGGQPLLPPLSVGEMALRLYAALNYNQNSARDLRCALNGCLRCLLSAICTHPLAKAALTLHLARSEGHERYFGCNLMQRKVLAPSHQHLMTEAPRTGHLVRS